MPYYSELGIYTPSTSYTSGFIKGPYSNHSSLLSSSYSLPKPLHRNFRGFKSHLAPISESGATALRRVNSPKLLYHSSPKVRIPRPIKINTADIDVSSNKYKTYERPGRELRPKNEETIERKSKSPSPKSLESPRSSEKEAKPNSNIRRDRATVRLQTYHKDALNKEMKEIRSWRDNFKPEDLVTEAKRRRKTPGEILKEKFLIRSKSKENIPSVNTNLKPPVKKSPSFKDICDVITSEDMVEDLNPYQPVEVRRRQSRQLSGDDLLHEIKRNSSTLSNEEVEILDALLQAESNSPMQEELKPRSSVRKKKTGKKKTLAVQDKSDSVSPNRIPKSPSKDETKSPLQRRGTVKKSSSWKDISQVEIEHIPKKPKKIITGTVGDIEENVKQSLKAIVNEVEIEESPKPKKEKKFRFNVTVEEIEEKRRSIKPKKPLYQEEKRNIQIPDPQKPVIACLINKQNVGYSGQVLEEIKRDIPKEEDVKKKLEINRSESEGKVSEKKHFLYKSVENKSSPVLSARAKFMQKENEELKKGKSLVGDNIKLLKKQNETGFKEGSVDYVEKSWRKQKKENENEENSKNEELIVKEPKEAEPKVSNFELQTDMKKKTSLKQQGDIDKTETKTKPEISNLIGDNLEKTPKIEDKQQIKTDIKLLEEPRQIEEQTKPEFFKDTPSSPKTVEKKELKTQTKSETRKSSIKQEKSTEKPKKVSKLTIEGQKSTEPLPKSSSKLRKEEKSKKDENDHFYKSSDTSPQLGKLKLDSDSHCAVLKEEEATGNDASDANRRVLDNDSVSAPRKLVSKRSLIQKANKTDPDLVVFEPPETAPDPPKEPTPEKDVFVPLQSNRLSTWMHPWKKPQQSEEPQVEIYAKPKFIRTRHVPRRWRKDVPESESAEGSSEEETSEESEDDSEEEEETSDEEYDVRNVKVGASTSSDDSGFDSGRNKDKGSIDNRDSPSLNPALNPAFALDSNDIPEEYSQSSTYASFQKSGRITPPATTIPRFRKYCVDDFNFLKVLGKGSFGKVLLAELKDTEYYYAVKCLKKDVVLEDDDVECTLIERKVLALGTKHPYLCHLLCTFQTESHLFFVMEYLNGGDLMFHIQVERRFSEARARFYGAEIVSGLKFLHNKGIVYRDLKLDNILLDFDGHVRIADFGMCKLQIFLDRMADTFCGTPDYMAPEIIKGQHYNQCVDWWSFGILLYEMLLGQSPFSGCDEDELFWSICNEKPVIPKFLSAEATSALLQFLEKDANKRLGNRFCPSGDIQDHPFFRPIDWVALEARQLEPPFKPNLQHPLDTKYFDETFTVEKAKLTPIETTILQSMDQTQFQGFSYTNPNATDK